jgi:hypothetical protein
MHFYQADIGPRLKMHGLAGAGRPSSSPPVCEDKKKPRCLQRGNPEGCRPGLEEVVGDLQAVANAWHDRGEGSAEGHAAQSGRELGVVAEHDLVQQVLAVQ